MIRSLVNRYKLFTRQLFNAQEKRFEYQAQKAKDGQEALNAVQTLYEDKKYIDALKLLNQIEYEYPECTKAAKYYRGKVSVALFEQEERLRTT